MRNIFVLILILAGTISCFAQTPAEKLESGVKNYNAMCDFLDSLNPQALSQQQIDKVKSMSDQAVAIFEDVILNGDAQQKETARYFKMNSRYELGFVYGMKGENQKAYDVLKPLESEMEYFGNSSRYPLRYVYDGKNYSIKFENFSSTLVEYYTGMAEICTNLSKYDDGIRFARKVETFPAADIWYRYIALNKIMEIKKKKDEFDREMMDAALKQIQVYSELDTSYLRTIKEYNYPTTKTSAAHIQKCIERDPSLSKGEYHRGTAAPIIARVGSSKTAVEFYIAAIEGGFGANDKAYLFGAAELGKKEYSNKLTRIACDALMKVYLSCDELNRVSELYKAADEDAKSADAAAKAKECEKKAEDAKAKAEKNRKKAECAGTFKLYAGVYPLGLITRYNSYRDYGGVAGIAIKNHVFEFSYKKINRNLEWTGDLFFQDKEYDADYGGRLLWDGSRMHFAWYVMPRNSSNEGFFLGPSFEMVNKTFEPVWSDLTRTDNGVFTASSQRFNIYDKGYSLYFNYGLMILENNFMFQWFTGFGVGRYSFTVDEPFDNDMYVYSNQLLEYRKPQRFNFVARMGITMGFYLGKR
jgi:hypothetical protein